MKASTRTRALPALLALIAAMALTACGSDEGGERGGRRRRRRSDAGPLRGPLSRAQPSTDRSPAATVARPPPVQELMLSWLFASELPATRRSSDHFTSSAVIGLPSCHFAPRRSLKVNRSPSGEAVQLSASSPRMTDWSNTWPPPTPVCARRRAAGRICSSPARRTRGWSPAPSGRRC